MLKLFVIKLQLQSAIRNLISRSMFRIFSLFVKQLQELSMREAPARITTITLNIFNMKFVIVVT